MPIQTPICDFGQKAHNFELKSTDNKILSLNDVKGENGTLIMFICNHCPYVKAVTKDIVEDCNELKKIGIKTLLENKNELIVEYTGTPEEITKLVKLLKNTKIIEQTRSGLVSIATGTDYIKK